MADEKKPAVFATGLYFKNKEVKGYNLISLSVKVDDFITFLNTHRNEAGYVNIDMWPSKEGSKHSHNAQLNDWKPDSEKAKTQAPSASPSAVKNSAPIDDDLPF
jgi:hypothetical protein